MGMNLSERLCPMEPNPQNQINIELGEKEAEGIYSNLALISHSPSEFIIDFARVLPGVPKAKIYSRIVTTPQNRSAEHTSELP